MWHYHGRKRPTVSQCKLSAVELQHGIILDKRFQCIKNYKLSAVEIQHGIILDKRFQCITKYNLSGVETQHNPRQEVPVYQKV